jgi:integrase
MKTVRPGGKSPPIIAPQRGPVELSNDLVRNFPAPERGAKTVWDGGHEKAVRGFGVRIFAPTKHHPGGARSFFLNYRVNGRERRFTIGEFPTLAVGEARARAKEKRQRVLAGEDPATAKREDRDAPTMQDLVARYITEHLRLPVMPPGTGEPRENPRLTDQRRMLAEIAERIGKDRKVKDVHSGDVKAMHRAITDSGRPVRANRILQIASKAFAIALEPRAGEDRAWRNALDGNPAKGIKKNAEEPRERFFSTNELTAIADALDAYPAQTPADCIRLIMLTGARPNEALRARWHEFDAEPGFWIRPSAHTKQRKTHRAPLAPAALELIARRRKERDDANPWVFPGAVPGQPLAALWHVWYHVRDHAGLGKDAHVYTLRHSFASIGGRWPLATDHRPVVGAHATKDNAKICTHRRRSGARGGEQDRRHYR